LKLGPSEKIRLLRHLQQCDHDGVALASYVGRRENKDEDVTAANGRKENKQGIEKVTPINTSRKLARCRPLTHWNSPAGDQLRAIEHH
jgi:hypothetical protein